MDDRGGFGSGDGGSRGDEKFSAEGFGKRLVFLYVVAVWARCAAHGGLGHLGSGVIRLWSLSTLVISDLELFRACTAGPRLLSRCSFRLCRCLDGGLDRRFRDLASFIISTSIRSSSCRIARSGIGRAYWVHLGGVFVQAAVLKDRAKALPQQRMLPAAVLEASLLEGVEGLLKLVVLVDGDEGPVWR
eukprot:scaffold1509_cov240-Pinguiococcus_pyrenoidosus.AAC.44